MTLLNGYGTIMPFSVSFACVAFTLFYFCHVVVSTPWTCGAGVRLNVARIAILDQALADDADPCVCSIRLAGGSADSVTIYTKEEGGLGNYPFKLETGQCRLSRYKECVNSLHTS